MATNLSLLVIALVLSVLLAEVGVRMVAPTLGAPDDVVLLVSEAPIRDDRGAIRYVPHRSVRQVLMYGDEVEFDTTFGTNDYGLVDDRDYATTSSSRDRYAVVGDSYTEAAVRPWVPALRDRLRSDVYALGIGATGVLAFERLLDSMSRHLAFTHIVIVAISDDFYRPVWRPVMQGDELRLCADTETPEACAQRLPIAYAMERNIPLDGLASRAREIRQRREGRGGAVRAMLRQFRIVRIARAELANAARSARRDGLVQQSRSGLARIRGAHRNARISLVHVPDRHETGRGRYDLDVAPLLTGLEIDYLPVLDRCSWSLDRYLPRDNHPNAAGYGALAQCVADMLESGAGRRAGGG